MKTTKKRRITKTRPVKRKVNKMLSPEEMTLVSNIESILQQLMQMGSGGGMAEEPATPVVMEAEDMPPKIDEDEDKTMEKRRLKKGLEETPSDAATASDDAEERMEEVHTELSAENVSEVEKAFKVLMQAMQKQNVKKSVNAPQSPLTQVLNKLVEVQKANQEQINDVSMAMTHILEGLGVAKQLDVVEEPARNPKSINKSQNDELLEVLKGLTQEKKEESSYINKASQSNKVRKTFSDPNILRGLLG